MAENNENNIQQDVSEVARIRREKLEALRGGERSLCADAV